MVAFHRDDVRVGGDGPVGTERAFRGVMHRIFDPEPFEIGAPGVQLIEAAVADVELIQRGLQGIGQIALRQAPGD